MPVADAAFVTSHIVNFHRVLLSLMMLLGRSLPTPPPLMKRDSGVRAPGSLVGAGSFVVAVAVVGLGEGQDSQTRIIGFYKYLIK